MPQNIGYSAALISALAACLAAVWKGISIEKRQDRLEKDTERKISTLSQQVVYKDVFDEFRNTQKEIKEYNSREHATIMRLIGEVKDRLQ